jgi:helicase SWR1
VCKVRTFCRLVQESQCDMLLAKWITASWYDLIKTVQDRIDAFDTIITKFVFVQPKAKSAGVQLISSSPKFQDIIERSTVYRKLTRVVSDELAMYYPARIRQQIFFPDRKLVQFDSGKLQTLCVLLRKLKAGGHKCLIFTQMSKMLDILEVFLNLNSHTYVRLDGSTGIDRRQKLMDRFNNDPKLFCFILSTRSGGLGINLTGADCVIFYDR